MAASFALWLADNGFGNIVRQEPVGGGCINDTQRLTMDAGGSIFLKQHGQPPDGMFHAEAVGLAALGKCGALRIPNVIHVEDNFLLLEDLGQGTPGTHFWKQLGEGLAKLHSNRHPRFGFSLDNYCGSTPQQNSLTEDGYEFFANYRILKLASQAFHRNLLTREDLSGLESIAARLADWIPEQPAVLIHGDLWSGNLHCDELGNPALIDPASYWGWAEAELAMTELFGGFARDFYHYYAEHSNLDGNWRERAPLYNLYHLLNHLLLFGSSYLAPIRNTINRFA
ncbi:MAG: fructosamine kinase family protein [Gammaproteobacteria bacterium]|jgi:fructosamine-3-kinase|nr:fructosamine kinase family protein [Gammaproteobacteria bacterium]